MALSPDDIRHFHEHGYLIKEGVFQPDELLPIKHAINEMTDMALTAYKEAGWQGDDLADVPMERRLARLYESDPQAAQKVLAAITGQGGGGYHGPAMLNALRHPGLLAIIQDLVGASIVGSSVYRIRPKLPGLQRGQVPWHQDSGYLLSHCDQHMIVTAWIPLVDANDDNGCMYIVPDMHKDAILRHRTGGPGGFLIIEDERLEQVKEHAICAACPAGGVVLMSNMTPHASFANSSDHVRWSLDLRYQGAAVPNNIGENPASMVPEREAVTMACYPPEADFVLQDPDHPEREVSDPKEFAAIRQRFEAQRPQHPGRGWQPYQPNQAARS